MVNIVNYIKGKINNDYFALFIIFFLYIFITIPNSPLIAGLGYDREIFQYIGMMIENGLSPYKDAFDHKPPIIYILCYIGYIITPNSTWGIFIIFNLIGFIASYLVYKSTKHLTNNVIISIITALCFTAICNMSAIMSDRAPIIGIDYPANGGIYTRQITAYFTVIILFLTIVKNDKKWKHLILGFLVGLIFFTQQNEVLAPSFLMLYSSTFKDNKLLKNTKEIITRFLYNLIGIAIAFSIIGGFIIYWNNWNDFLEQAFLFNFTTYIHKVAFHYKFLMLLENFFIIISKSKLLIFIICSTFIISFSAIISKRKIHYLTIVIICFIIQMISSSIPGRYYGNYYFSFIPFIIFVLILSFPKINKKLTLYSLVIFVIFLILDSTKVNYNKSKDLEIIDEICGIIESKKGQKGEFYSFNATYLRINYNLSITTPTKWIYTHFAEQKQIDEIINDIKYCHTSFILVDKVTLERFHNLRAFLYENYSESYFKNNQILLKKNFKIIYNNSFLK